MEQKEVKNLGTWKDGCGYLLILNSKDKIEKTHEHQKLIRAQCNGKYQNQSKSRYQWLKYLNELKYPGNLNSRIIFFQG